MPPKDPCSLLHIEVSICDCAQCLDESTFGFCVCADESGNPVWRRSLHVVAAVMDQQIANRQIGELHDTVCDICKIKGNFRLMQCLGKIGGRRMISTNADQHSWAKDTEQGTNSICKIRLWGRPS